jgi:hypothetical protein
VVTGVGPAILLISVLASGCASVHVEPFQQFAQAAVELQDNVNTALASGPEASEARFVRQLVQDRGLADQLLLRSDDVDPILWNPESAPLFLTAERFRTGVRRVAGVFVDYSNVLVELASPELLETGQFDQLATDLTANATSGLGALLGRPVDAEPFAMFSTVASELFRNYLESRRRSVMLEALRANQETIRRFSDLLVEATEIAAELSWQEYSELAGDELLAIPGLADDAAVEGAVGRMIELARAHIAHLEALGILRDAFAALPSSHAGLINAVENPDGGLAAINAALERSRTLESLFDELSSNASGETDGGP